MGRNQTQSVSPPTNLLATLQAASGSASTVQLTWNAPAGTITGYNIYRGTASGGESNTPLNAAPLAATAASYQDASVSAGGTYYYVVQALNGTSTSPNSSEAFVSVPASGTAPAASPAQLNLASSFNRIGISANGAKVSGGGLDGGGDALSATLVGKTVTSGSVSFAIGPTGANNVVSAHGQTIALTGGSFSTLILLATAVNGSQTNQTFVVHYTDGTTQSFTQNLSDWHTPQQYAGETVALAMAYRNTSSGGADRRTFNLYAYSLPLNNSKIVSSISLPNDANVEILAMTAVP